MKIDFGQLMEQASMTSNEYLIEALESVKKVPTLDDSDSRIVSALIIASSLDYLAGCITRALDDGNA